MSTTDSAIDLCFDTLPHPPCSRTTSTSSSDHILFGRKLGYAEELVTRALAKLGPEPSQNELLNELISLDDGGSGGSGGQNSGVVGVGGGELSGGAGDEETAVESDSEQLRHIVVDGSNVAITAGNNSEFSTTGLKDCVDYFISRGHPLTLFLPSFRKSDPTISDPTQVLAALEKSGHLVWTPSRSDPSDRTGSRKTICYDDRFILKLAVETEGVVVSNDNYRDFLVGEGVGGGEFRRVIEERLLMFSFVRGRFTPPEDPLGRSGPSLHQFLRKSRSPSAPPCPYARKCTYGSKCKYYHEFKQKSVSDALRKQAANKTQSMPLSRMSCQTVLTRTRSAVEEVKRTDQPPPPVIRGHRKLERQLSINPFELEPNRGTTTSSFRELPPFPGDSSLNSIWGNSMENSATSDRSKLRYHLSQLFPQDRVDRVLATFPDCTDAGLLCAEISKLG